MIDKKWPDTLQLFSLIFPSNECLLISAKLKSLLRTYVYLTSLWDCASDHKQILPKRKMLHSFVAQVTKLELKGGNRKKGIKREGDRSRPPFHPCSPLIWDTLHKGVMLYKLKPWLSNITEFCFWLKLIWMLGFVSYSSPKSFFFPLFKSLSLPLSQTDLF